MGKRDSDGTEQAKNRDKLQVSGSNLLLIIASLAVSKEVVGTSERPEFPCAGLAAEFFCISTFRYLGMRLDSMVDHYQSLISVYGKM